MHDRHRCDLRGGGSSTPVTASLDLLRAPKVEFNVLTVVNRDNSRCPLEVYRFLREVGVTCMQFIPVVERADAAGRLAGPPGGRPDSEDLRVTPWSVRPDDYGDFLCAIFDEWIRHDVGRVFVQFFDLQLGQWMGEPATLCVFAETCGLALAVEHNGDVFACDHYVYPEYCVGNVMERPIGTMVAAPEQRRFGADKRASLPEICRQCHYLFACNGGCPKHRFLPAPGSEEGLNYFCVSNRQFFEHAGCHLGAMAGLIRRGPSATAIMPMLANAENRRSPAGRNDPCPCGSGRKFKRCCGMG